jgi:tetratricopeptide (TPR) repeat protein
MAFSSSRKRPRKKKKLKKEYKAAKQVKREKLLHQDRLKLAKHYEKLKLYDDAIKYYKLLKMEDEVKRLSEIKFNRYLPKAKEFESQGSYEDAIRLFEQLNMIDDVNRIKAKIGKPTSNPETGSDEPDTEPGQDDEEEILDDLDVIDFKEEDDIEWDKPNVFKSEPEFINEQNGSEEVKKKGSKQSGKTFTICPYCGEELNLPKQPNFCPYCKEPFV